MSNRARLVECSILFIFPLLFQDGTLKSDILTNEMIPDINKIVASALAGDKDDDSTSTPPAKTPLLQTKVDNLSPVLDFLEGKNCLTGVSFNFSECGLKQDFMILTKVTLY